MHCDKVMHKFNDLLDRTLPAKEEHEMQAHLAICPDCRVEFQLVKNADDMLRATVLEMLAEIEVSSNLSQKIGQVLSKEKKQNPWKTKLFVLLQAPALAAVMLMLVVASGVFGYYRLFDPSGKNPTVVMSVPQDQPSVESTGETKQAPLPAVSQDQASVKDDITTEAPYRAAGPLAPETVQIADGSTRPIADTGVRSTDSVARQTAPSGRGGGDALNPTDKAAGLSQTPAADEQSIPMLSSKSTGDKLSVSSVTVSRQGNLQEAARAMGFAPAVPAYLPPGAELNDVTWSPGTVFQEYRAEHNTFSLTQKRVDGVGVTGAGSSLRIDINGVKAYLQETGSYTTVTWQRGEWVLTIGGDFPREEIMKIARSVK